MKRDRAAEMLREIALAQERRESGSHGGTLTGWPGRNRRIVCDCGNAYPVEPTPGDRNYSPRWEAHVRATRVPNQPGLE